MVQAFSGSSADPQEASGRLAQLTAIEAAWQRRKAPLHPGDRLLWIGIGTSPETSPPGAMQSNFVLSGHDEEGVSLFRGDAAGSVDALPFSAASASHVVVQHAQEIANDGDDLLAQCAQLLKPAGVLMVFGFHPWSMWQQQIRLRTDVRVQTPGYWARSLEALGLEVKRAERIGPAWPGAPGLFDRFGMAFALRASRTGAAIIPIASRVRAPATRGFSMATRNTTSCRRSA